MTKKKKMMPMMPMQLSQSNFDELVGVVSVAVSSSSCTLELLLSSFFSAVGVMMMNHTILQYLEHQTSLCCNVSCWDPVTLLEG